MDRRLSLAVPLRNEVSFKVYPAQMMMWAKAAIDWKQYAADDAVIGVRTIGHCHVQDARCTIGAAAADEGDEIVLWMDDDMDPPVHAFHALYNVYQSFVKQGVKVGGVSAACHSAYPPFHSYLKTGEGPWLPIGKGAAHLPDVVEVIGCGFGLILTPGEVLRAVKEKHGKARMFEWRPYGFNLGEDQDFVNKARELGYRFFGLPHLEVGHLHVGITDSEYVAQMLLAEEESFSDDDR